MRNSIYDLEDTRLEIGSVTTTPSFKGKPGVGFTTNSTPYAFLLRDFTSEVFGNNTQVIEWSHTHNMNDYKEAGTYRIKGERTGNPLDDNLPIMNQGSGHTIEGILYVLDSSLTNGSGNSDDCTITQFLMLSNRVGGQEGDMYMRSAYGANKDNLTWKPWEKYQTNMEVGVVTDAYTVNPQNPTQIIKFAYGMKDLTDNGIYSGVYIGPKCMVGTTEDNYHITFQDATAIETFVMVVINNYAVAGDARCITQIKFAVTNGGVFSMEKRRTQPGTTTDWSQWESVGGGSSSLGEWDSLENFNIYNPFSLERSNTFGHSITIGTGVRIDSNILIKRDAGQGSIKIKYGDDNIIAIGTDGHDFNVNTPIISLGKKIHISEGVCIGTGFNGNTNDNYLKVQLNENGDKVIFSYAGKTAELPLTEASAS